MRNKTAGWRGSGQGSASGRRPTRGVLNVTREARSTLSSTFESTSATPLIQRLNRAGAAIVVVVIACAVHTLAPYDAASMNRHYGTSSFSFTGASFLWLGATVYSLAILAYHLFVPEPGPTKSQRFFRVVTSFLRSPRRVATGGLNREDRVALLATLLKAYFGPMMAVSLMQFCMGALDNGSRVFTDMQRGTDLLRVFDSHGFWMLVQVIIFVDVLFFTVGYLVESPRLNNQIRSVDPTWLGWAAALACYPPFNSITNAMLGSAVGDFPRFDNAAVHVSLNAALLTLLAIYTSSSVALGLKASNLTHRGIVARGPYAIVRHPAYTCKNMAWWIACIPLVAAAFSQSPLEGILAIAAVVGWTLLYVLRALTEEDHLRKVDGEYDAYAQKVRYRFIPGVY